jgi:hypothetical protein
MIFQQMPGASTEENFKRLVADLNRFHPTIDRMPTFADNASAKAANLKVGAPYVDDNGFVRRVI